MLDDMAMPDEKETAKIFNAMISDSDVWLPVLSALHPQSSLMEHPKVLTAQMHCSSYSSLDKGPSCLLPFL